MSTRYPGEFKFDFGSAVTVLTTAAAGQDFDKHIKNQGIFTGVILDETILHLKRDSKHITISLDDPTDEDEQEAGAEPGWAEKDYPAKDKYQFEEKQPEKYYDPDKHGQHDCEKHHEKPPLKIKETETFLVLSLTSPSYPFKPRANRIYQFGSNCRDIP